MKIGTTIIAEAKRLGGLEADHRTRIDGTKAAHS